MTAIKQIQTFPITKLLAGAHYKFHADTIGLITKATPEVLHLETLFPLYKKAVETEYSIVNPNKSKLNTQEIARADKTRDMYLNLLIHTVKSLKNNPAEQLLDRAIYDFWRIIAPFRGTASYEMEKETALIRALIRDLKADPNFSVLENRIGKHLLASLESANEEVAKLLKERIDEGAGKNYIDPLVARRETDELYRLLIRNVNAFAISMPTEEIHNFIDLQNVLVHEYRDIISHMRRGGSGNEKLPGGEDDFGDGVEIIPLR